MLARIFCSQFASQCIPGLQLNACMPRNLPCLLLALLREAACGGAASSVQPPQGPPPGVESGPITNLPQCSCCDHTPQLAGQTGCHSAHSCLSWDGLHVEWREQGKGWSGCQGWHGAKKFTRAFLRLTWLRPCPCLRALPPPTPPPPLPCRHCPCTSRRHCCCLC